LLGVGNLQERHVKLFRTLTAVTALAGAACGPLHLGSRNEATVIFTNDSLQQADVYATIADADAVRIGTVLAARTDTLSVPSSVTTQAGGQTNIYARLLAASARPSTGLITLRPSDVIHVRLTTDARALFVTPGT
jgi:hypothetical protein